MQKSQIEIQLIIIFHEFRLVFLNFNSSEPLKKQENRGKKKEINVIHEVHGSFDAFPSFIYIKKI